MVNLFLSAFLGVLAGKIIDILQGSKKKQNGIYLFTGVLCVCVACIYTLDVKSESPVFISMEVKKLIDGWDDNLIAQAISFCAVLIGIMIINSYEGGLLTFDKYSKRIYDFTSRAHDGSNVVLVAGDMDFFGGIKTEETEIPYLMEESKEYNQLLQLADKIKLKILCNNKLEEKLFNAIMTDTISPRVFYNKYRIGGNLGSSSFQQLLRIGKIKSDFGRSVEIKFYNSDDEDTRFRGRFIGNEGLLYRKETEK